ncbi:acylphosphatase [Coleofasciculus sp. FACHB-64]|uniref:acylphosphatase n=1 Tax=Cyanophyceae TaxID=3028117 RepID=UPI001687BC05|nr:MULTISPECIES: acylphosphatase [unclassified Coleofasciculus]MBD1837651.1 acylphosphatase [Coleofasciculus sp. FACHB-501]MBD1893462.1 acylphosphatase [Coleofasciculus sp. FACHB-129]MBD2048213.1 acylphosphatase [Coleofasciculus sp. FACHB-64]
MQNSSASTGQIRAHVIVSGTVQGVGFRFSTLDEAIQLGVSGWVQNLPDGRVEAVFEGSKADVEEVIQWCHKGPPAAVVKAVAVEYETPEGLRGFEMWR